MGEVSLLQNDQGVQDMLVQKMYPHRRPRRRSYRAFLHRAAPQASLGRESHLVRPRLFPRGRGFTAPYLLCCSTMLCCHVPCQLYSRHLVPALSALHLSLLSILVGGSLSRHTSPVHHLRLGPLRRAWSADHADCIPKIIPQDHPTEQADQGTKCTLDPLWV